ncbi:MAG: metallophosphoesterase [Myxococcota bacterium]
MNARMLRMLGLMIVLVSLGEVVILHWATLVLGGSGLSLGQALLGGVGFGALNVLAFPPSRRSIHARGLALVLSRTWILGSIAALFTGVLLTAVFLVLGGAAALIGGGAGVEGAFVRLGGAVVALGFGSVMWGASVGNYRVRVDRVSLPFRGAPESLAALRIVHASDFHIGPLLRPERLRGFVKRINRLEPDLVLLTGDLFDFDPAYIEEGCRELGNLRARLGVFAVLGNHDVYTGTDAVVEGLRRLTSIRLLRDEWERVDVDGAALAIVGIDDSGRDWTEREAKNSALERLAREVPDGLPRLLLAHRPSYFTHASQLGFPLVLSGHTHGGQVALPFAHQWNPSRMISDRTRGIFQNGAGALYVSRGLGMAGLPLRINCPREIALIQLIADPS